MKKMISVLCVIAVLLSLSALAFATEDTQQNPPVSDGQQTNWQKPFGPPDRIDFDDMVSSGVISQETCDNIKAYLEEHKPADLPETDDQRPDADGQAPGGEAPTDLPELPDRNGQAPQGNGRGPGMGGQFRQKNGRAPGMGSQLPQMNGQGPDRNGQPTQRNGQMPGGDTSSDLPEQQNINGELPEAGGGNPAGDCLLNDLLKDGIITQAEHDALCEAMNK